MPILDKDIPFYQTAIDSILRLALPNTNAPEYNDLVYLKGRLNDISIFGESVRAALVMALEDHHKDMSIAELRLLVESMTDRDKSNLRRML